MMGPVGAQAIAIALPHARRIDGPDSINAPRHRQARLAILGVEQAQPEPVGIARIDPETGSAFVHVRTQRTHAPVWLRVRNSSASRAALWVPVKSARMPPRSPSRHVRRCA